MRNIRSIGILSALTLLTVSFAGGCTTYGPPPPTGKPGVEAAFDVNPKQMADFVKRVVMAPPLSLPVDADEGGTITTGWQRFPGEWHIARRWQERTRYFITIVPDWEKPEAKCRVQVTAETEQRAVEGQTWDPAPELNRAARSEALLQQIRDASARK